MTDRIELESKVAMLERTVDGLSGELHEHAKLIEVLQASIKRLAEQVQSKGGDGEVEPHNTPPPHYGS